MTNSISVPFILTPGPAGPAGSPGAPGATGPAGPAGGLNPGLAAQIPVTNAGASGVVMQTISQDVSVAADGTATVHGANVPATASLADFGQLQSTSAGNGVIARLRSQAAKTGSNGIGGGVSLLAGKLDGSSWTLSPRITFGEALALDPTTVNESTFTNFFEYAAFGRSSSGVVGIGFGGGSTGTGGGVISVELSCFSPLSIATEAGGNGNGTIQISPASLGGGTSRATWNFQAWQDGSAQLQVQSAAGQNAANGIFAIDWSGSSTYQALWSQRDSGNANDLPIAARWTGQLVLGSFAENPAHWGQSGQTFRALQTGTGFQFQNQSPSAAGTQALLTIASDNHASLVQGDTLAGTSDAVIQQIYTANTTSTTASQTIATIPLRGGTNAADYVNLVIIGRCPSTGDMASFERRALYTNNGGTITLVGSAASIGNDPHTAGAGAAINPLLTISGSNLLVQVTPWTATATHWTVYPDQFVNSSAATAAATPTPPGSPVIWVNADLQALGSVTTWSDQSGNGHNLTSASTAPVNTANAGPSGAQRALVYSGNGYLQIANALGLGVSNCTLAIIAKVTSTSASQTLLSVGAFNGVTLAVDSDATQHRSVDWNGGSPRALAGLATTSWESWILTVDTRGNWYLLINGVAKALNPLNVVPNSPSAGFVVGANLVGTGIVTGDIYDVAAWATAQDPYAVYAYHHAITGGAV